MDKKNNSTGDVAINCDHLEQQKIQSRIYTIRGEQVMLDNDLAEMYGVETKQLKRQVKRNIERFPQDFMFELTKEELYSLRCQNGTLENGRGKYTKYLPYAFTEQGVSQLSGILRFEVIKMAVASCL